MLWSVSWGDAWRSLDVGTVGAHWAVRVLSGDRFVTAMGQGRARDPRCQLGARRCCWALGLLGRIMEHGQIWGASSFGHRRRPSLMVAPKSVEKCGCDKNSRPPIEERRQPHPRNAMIANHGTPTWQPGSDLANNAPPALCARRVSPPTLVRARGVRRSDKFGRLHGEVCKSWAVSAEVASSCIDSRQALEPNRNISAVLRSRFRS